AQVDDVIDRHAEDGAIGRIGEAERLRRHLVRDVEDEPHAAAREVEQRATAHGCAVERAPVGRTMIARYQRDAVLGSKDAEIRPLDAVPRGGLHGSDLRFAGMIAVMPATWMKLSPSNFP